MPRQSLARVSGAGFLVFALVVAACSDSKPATRNLAASDSVAALRDLAQDGPIEICIHSRISQWECPDSLARISRIEDIQKITVIVTLANGDTSSRDLPGNTDAIFLTKPSTRMFLLPYYERTNPAEAAALTARLNRP